MSERQRRETLDAVGELDERLADELNRDVYTFDDLDMLSDEEMRLVTQRAYSRNRNMIGVALRQCSDTMRYRLLDSLTATIRNEIEYRISTMGKRPISEVARCQQEIVAIARELEAEGVLSLDNVEPLV